MHFIDIALAFVEGMVLIISPCILPILPFILSSSVQTGKNRPLTIIFGFILAFSLFAFFSRKIVMILAINLDMVRAVSLVILALFGLILLFDGLSRKLSFFTQGIANVGMQYSSKTKDSVVGGLLMGMLLGLVWTPCAGPILATVLVQVIREQSDLMSFFIIVAFAFGVGIPMVIIALTGRVLIAKLQFLQQHAALIRKTLGILIILSAVYMGFISNLYSLPNPDNARPAPAVTENALTLEKALPIPIPAPEFVGIEQWLNSKALSMQTLRNKVVLVDFWTYSCINCIRTLPYLTNWDAKYRDKGLVIVGVHSPEFEFEKNAHNVQGAIDRYHIRYPVALDNNLATFVNFKNLYWPAQYLINQQGQIVYVHFGEGEDDVTENNIRYLLNLSSQSNNPGTMETNLSFNQTPETYLGYTRAERYAGQPLQQDTLAEYPLVATVPEHSWSLGGQWLIQGDKIISKAKDAKLLLHFNAKKVFLVMGSVNGEPLTLTLTLNGQVGDSKIVVSDHRLYELVSQPASQNGVLAITVPAGVEMYAFTFGG